MKIIRGLHRFDSSQYRQPIVIAIGTFDGVHRAHQAIIRRAVAHARRVQGTSVIITFSPHPRQVAVPHEAPQLLTAITHRLRLIAQGGPDVCVVVNFQRQFARLTPEQFLTRIVRSRLGTKIVVVGEKFNFGRDRSGTLHDLQQGGRRLGFEVDIVPAVTSCGAVISSSAIRAYIGAGNLARARCMLGRPYSLVGTVVRGDRRGRRLGFPTANLDPQHEIFPPEGVYAVRVMVGQRWFGGMCSIGTQPTFSPAKRQPLIEVNVFGLNKTMYGHEMEVQFIRRLRAQRRFAGTQELIRQMKRDARHARTVLAGLPPARLSVEG